MIQATIRKIEERLRGDAIDPARKKELLRLLEELKSELRVLEATHAAEARRIVGLTDAAHEAVRKKGNAAERRDAAAKLTESVREFEVSHPKLTSVVEAVANSLAAAGL